MCVWESVERKGSVSLPAVSAASSLSRSALVLAGSFFPAAEVAAGAVVAVAPGAFLSLPLPPLPLALALAVAVSSERIGGSFFGRICERIRITHQSIAALAFSSANAKSTYLNEFSGGLHNVVLHHNHESAPRFVARQFGVTHYHFNRLTAANQ